MSEVEFIWHCADKSEYEPDYLVTPGEIVEEWSNQFRNVEDMADEVGVEPGLIMELINGYRPITPAIAEKLSKLGRPAHFWLNLERDYQADRQRLSGIDPWIPVAEQEPPKDGSEFLWRMGGGDSVPLFQKWDKNSSKWVDRYGNELIVPFEEGEWLPIPGGEK